MKNVPIAAVLVSSTMLATCLFSSSSVAVAQELGTSVQSASGPVSESRFGKFQPKSETVDTRIDFSSWNEALAYFVFDMGPSIRESAPSVEPGLGTRRIYGHESRYRLEGNRVIFSYLEEDVKTALTEYRTDLERTADLVDIASLPRNEQLAFWINLHNVAIIEKIALEYPVSQPSLIRLDGSSLPLDETPFLTVGGVSMSPKDIRTKIVYPNWSNPKVIYGFFRGEIGGPSIQREAFTADNINDLLDSSAKEFVNSLRGAQKNGNNLNVSKIYQEASPFFFANWDADIRHHLLTYSAEPVSSEVEAAKEIRANVYEGAISDMANGERDPNYGFVIVGDRPKGFRIANNIARLLVEKSQKTEKINRRSDVEGRVTVIDVSEIFKDNKPEEVE